MQTMWYAKKNISELVFKELHAMNKTNEYNTYIIHEYIDRSHTDIELNPLNKWQWQLRQISLAITLDKL